MNIPNKKITADKLWAEERSATEQAAHKAENSVSSKSVGSFKTKRSAESDAAPRRQPALYLTVDQRVDAEARRAMPLLRTMPDKEAARILQSAVKDDGKAAAPKAKAEAPQEVAPSPPAPEADGTHEGTATESAPDPLENELTTPGPSIETGREAEQDEARAAQPKLRETGTQQSTAGGAAASEPAPDPETKSQTDDAPETGPEAKHADPETDRDVTAKRTPTSKPGALPGDVIEGDTGPLLNPGHGGQQPPANNGGKGGGGGGGGGNSRFHKPAPPDQFVQQLNTGTRVVKRNLSFVMLLTCATNILVLAIPIYLFQISDRVLTSRSLDTLIMLTVVIVGAVVMQAIFDAVRRFILMRTAVEVAVRLGAPVLAAAAHASLHDNGRQYQTLGDLNQLRAFLTSGTLISFLDVPFAPLFILAIFLVHPHLGMIVVVTAIALMVIALINQKVTAKPFAEANKAQSMANMHLDSMSRNSQIINALAMVPEAVSLWGRDTANSLRAQVKAQDRNIAWAAVSRAARLLTQIAMLGWGAYLAIQGEITGGMVIAASIIAGRALAPIEGSIEGWNGFILSRGAYDRVKALMYNSVQRFEKLVLPDPKGQLNVERLLYVPAGTKQVILNGLTFALNPGESLAVIGNSGAGKTTLGKMLVGSILPTSGNVRLDLMDLRNWDTRQLGENIGYLPQDVQLFPGSIKANIARMRVDVSDADVHRAALLADVHDMIAMLPHGYETMVQADGAPLSGGQKQRIALARAFFGNPRFLVLDEPNSNLDTAGDRALANAIRHAGQHGITVVVITQKPSLLSVVDKIMVMADGNIAMFGHRQQVLQQLAQRSQGNGNLPPAQNSPGGQPNV